MERERPEAWSAVVAGIYLSLSHFFKSLTKTEKQRKKKERKEMSGQEFGHGDYFPGLTKMSLTQEKWSGQDCKN